MIKKTKLNGRIASISKLGTLSFDNYSLIEGELIHLVKPVVILQQLWISTIITKVEWVNEMPEGNFCLCSP